MLEYTIFHDTPARGEEKHPDSGSKEYALASGRAVRQLSATEFEITADGTLITVGESATNRRPQRAVETTSARGSKRRSSRKTGPDQKRTPGHGPKDSRGRGPKKKR